MQRFGGALTAYCAHCKVAKYSTSAFKNSITTPLSAKQLQISIQPDTDIIFLRSFQVCRKCLFIGNVPKACLS